VSAAAGALAVVLVLLAAPSSARGASVGVFVPHCELEQSKYGMCYPDEARFAAAPGEVNKLTITSRVDPPSFQPKITFHDDGATLQARDGCSQVDMNTAECTGYNLIAVVDAGDGDDTVEGTATMDGGPGNDVLSGSGALTGGPGDDVITGGDQGDFLRGGPGADTLSGGAGNDTLQPDAGERGDRDVVDGGDGTDMADYSARSDDLSVSLQQPLAGEDALSAVEGIRGGKGDDHLTGDAGPNTLEGRGGADLLIGGEGDDLIGGDEGPDRVQGGPGADRLSGGEDRSGRNVIDCGDGADVVDPVNPSALLLAGCEDVGQDALALSGGDLRLHVPPRLPRGPLVTIDHLGCIERPCTATVNVTVASGLRRGQALAGLHYKARRGRRTPGRLRATLTPAAGRLLARNNFTAKVSVNVRDGFERTRLSFLISVGGASSS